MAGFGFSVVRSFRVVRHEAEASHYIVACGRSLNSSKEV